MVKTKIIKRRVEIKIAKKQHNLIRCKCRKCGEKKWSQYNKRSSKVLCLAIINLVVWGVAIDGFSNWYGQRSSWVFENASAAVFEETSLIETAQSVSGWLEVSGMAAKSPASVAVSVGGNQLPSVSGSAIEVIQKVARETDTDWKVLAAICIKESNCNTNRIGDGGLSYGAFQMHQKWQPNTKSCAVDFECAATWTAKRLKKHEHLGLWDMIRSHNGLVGDRNGDGEVDNAYYPNDVLKIIETL